MNQLLLFAIIQVVNVTISTVKFICTIKSTPTVAAITNSISYSISAVVTYFIAKQELWPVLIITFLSNLIGVPIGRYLIDKFQKDKLWVYDATIRADKYKVEELRNSMKELHDVHSTWETIVDNQLYAMKFFVSTKEQSKILKDKFNSLDVKYHIIEPR